MMIQAHFSGSQFESKRCLKVRDVAAPKPYSIQTVSVSLKSPFQTYRFQLLLVGASAIYVYVGLTVQVLGSAFHLVLTAHYTSSRKALGASTAM